MSVLAKVIEVTNRCSYKLDILDKPARYKVLYGGRGGSKSWGVARKLLMKGVEKPLRILCTREFQSSIRASVHELLSTQIRSLGLQDYYEIQQASIKGVNGTEFFFEGLKLNVAKIKSFEGVDIAWVEEAQTVSKTSWDTLIPTIRKANSEIWITFNPELEEDETYQRFVLNPPPNALVQKINWSDNPDFPDVLKQEMEYLKVKDPDAYQNVWEGHTRKSLEGAIYAKELREAENAERITNVPYDHTKPVHTFWDLGWSDKTAIWFAQSIGFEYRIINFIQGRQRSIQDWLLELQSFQYVYGTDWLPHDADHEQLGAAGRSIADQMRNSGRKVRVVPRMAKKELGINAARTIFPNCWFDAQRAAEGLRALRMYRYEVDPDTKQYSRVPLHDDHSHAADAFACLALSLQEQKPKMPERQRQPRIYNMGSASQNLGWMKR